MISVNVVTACILDYGKNSNIQSQLTLQHYYCASRVSFSSQPGIFMSLHVLLG